MKFLWLLFLPFFAATVQAQPLPDRAPFRGVVTDQNGQPIPGVYLTLRRQNDGGSFAFWGGETSSGAKGEFIFPDAEAGDFFLNAEAPGFAAQTNVNVNWKRGDAPFRLTLSRLTRLILKLTRGGAPLATTQVFVRLRGDGAAGQIQRSVRTDPSGQIVFEQIAPANYGIWAHTGDFYGAISAQTISYSPSGTTREIALRRGASLRATLQDESKAGLGGANFGLNLTAPENAGETGTSFADLGDDYAMLASGGQGLLTSREGDGSIELHGLPPGRYNARFGGAGGPDLNQGVELKSGETSKITFTSPSKQGAKLALDFKNKAGEPLKNREVTVRLVRIAENGAVASEGNEGDYFMPGGVGIRRGQTGDVGRLALYPVSAGIFRVFASLASNSGKTTRAKESAPLDVTVAQNGATASIVLPE